LRKKRKAPANRWYEDIWEVERFELERPAKHMQTWMQKSYYAITEKGTVYSKITFTEPGGKQHRGSWKKSGVQREALIEKGFKLTIRRKPKKLSLKD